MDFNNSWTDIPVLLLFNINPTWSQQDIQECLTATHELSEALISAGHPVQEVCLQSTDLETVLRNFDPEKFLVFNWCEELPGISRSEASVAQILENLGYTFTGASSRTLAIGQEKPRVKDLLHRHRVRSPVWQVYSSSQKIHWKRFPAIVKLAYEHSSYGITRESVVQSVQELEKRVSYVNEELSQPALVEEFIDGREFHVGVIGNDDVRVLPPAEIDYSFFQDIHDRLCTYESNFDKTSLAYQQTIPKFPARLTEEQLSRLEELALSAYRAIDCRDYARMDLRLRDGRFYLLDVNPNPDISADTSLVKGAEMIGLSYGKLGSLLINLAARRHPNSSIFLQPAETGEERCLDSLE
jgi:D-alanine-D-alanine ligase